MRSPVRWSSGIRTASSGPCRWRTCAPRCYGWMGAGVPSLQQVSQQQSCLHSGTNKATCCRMDQSPGNRTFTACGTYLLCTLGHNSNQKWPDHAGTVGRKRKAAEPADGTAASKATIPRQRPRKSAAPAPAAESRPLSASRPSRAGQRAADNTGGTSSSSDDEEETPSTSRRRGQPRGGGQGRGAPADHPSDTDATRSDTADGTEGRGSGRGRGRGRGARGGGRGRGRSSNQGAAAATAAASNSAPAAASGYAVPADFDAGLLSGAEFVDKKTATRTVPEVFFRRWRTLRTEVSAALSKSMWLSCSALPKPRSPGWSCQEHVTCHVADSIP